jgi:hypothetical protein
MMAGSAEDGLRRAAPGATRVLLRYVAGDSLAQGTATRGTSASATTALADTLLRYQAGGGLAQGTVTRGSAALAHGNA